mmetsp:Transcript_32119/g.70380  ORF Transcript_32119/g.70380 Transcript_32119/m.70380 type:complete len:103 (-) Transcript_32119:159-467(-)|eukprot:23885-Pleurochrysis_carterae.AAC.3
MVVQCATSETLSDAFVATTDFVSPGAIVKAAWKGHLDALHWMLLDEAGPKLRSQLLVRDHEGRSAADLARMNSKDDVASWLDVLIAAAEADAAQENQNAATH